MIFLNFEYNPIKRKQLLSSQPFANATTDRKANIGDNKTKSEMANKIRYGMSTMLNHGCQKFGEKALNEDTFDDIINISQKNMAALIFGYTSIEAFINEIITISEVSKRLSINKEYFEVLIELEKKLSIKDKYNWVQTAPVPTFKDIGPSY